MGKEKWYRTGAVAEETGISQYKLRALAKEGLIESRTSNRMLYIPGSAVERLKANGAPAMPAKIDERPEPEGDREPDDDEDQTPATTRCGASALRPNRRTAELYAEPSRQLAKSKEKVIRLEHAVEAKRLEQHGTWGQPACFLGNMDREISAGLRVSTFLTGRSIRSWETSADKFWLRAPAGVHKCWPVPSQALCPEPVRGGRSLCSPPSKTRSRPIYPRNQLKTKHRPETAPSRRSIMVEGGTRQSEGNKVVPGPIPATLLRHQPKKARKCTKLHKPNRGGFALRGLNRQISLVLSILP
jgi:hypothetical protein